MRLGTGDPPCIGIATVKTAETPQVDAALVRFSHSFLLFPLFTATPCRILRDLIGSTTAGVPPPHHAPPNPIGQAMKPAPLVYRFCLHSLAPPRSCPPLRERISFVRHEFGSSSPSSSDQNRIGFRRLLAYFISFSVLSPV